MLDLRFCVQFKRDRRRCVRRGYDMNLLSAAVETLRIPAALPVQNRAHTLTGICAGYQECHLAPDLLLVYRVEGNELQLARTGTHSGYIGNIRKTGFPVCWETRLFFTPALQVQAVPLTPAPAPLPIPQGLYYPPAFQSVLLISA